MTKGLLQHPIIVSALGSEQMEALMSKNVSGLAAKAIKSAMESVIVDRLSEVGAQSYNPSTEVAEEGDPVGEPTLEGLFQSDDGSGAGFSELLKKAAEMCLPSGEPAKFKASLENGMKLAAMSKVESLTLENFNGGNEMNLNTM